MKSSNVAAKNFYMRQGKSDTWVTPREITQALGRFDLDPCAAVHQPWSHAVKNYTEEDNGLLHRWRGRVWMNPPYSAGAIMPFVHRFVDHGNGIALVFPRTETLWFQLLASRSDAMFLMGERIRFCRVDGSPGGTFLGNVFFAIGRRNVQALRAVTWSGLLFDGPKVYRPRHAELKSRINSSSPR